MIQPIKKFAVNWTDGMKISERHLVAHDNFILDTIRDTSSLHINNFNYGLLPVETTNFIEDSYFDVFKTATEDVQVNIKHCRALTAAGYRIELSNYKTNIKSLVTQGEQTEEDYREDYYIIISVNPFKRVPFGDIDAEETPPRHPHTRANHTIQLLPEISLKNGDTGGNYIIIGKVTLGADIITVDQNFIPPCTTLHSHPTLISYYNAFAKSMGDIQQYSVKIVQKVAQNKQDSSLARNIKNLCNILSTHFADIYFQYRNMIPQQPPIYLVEVFSGMALKLYHNTQTLATEELEEMLNYTYEWSNISPVNLIEELSAVSEINYNHNDCQGNFVMITQLLHSLEIIFNKLSSLDYIGERKENIIVNEKDITPEPKVKRGWSLLD